MCVFSKRLPAAAIGCGRRLGRLAAVSGGLRSGQLPPARRMARRRTWCRRLAAARHESAAAPRANAASQLRRSLAVGGGASMIAGGSMVAAALGLLLLALPAGSDVISPKRWVVRHGFGTTDVSFSRIAPIQRFPTSHPKVADGVCGGVAGSAAEDRLIRPTDAWSTAGRVHAGDDSCQYVSGAEAFFAYNFPVAHGSNTGFQEDDTEIVMLLQDTDGAGYLLLNHDKPGNLDGGRTNVILNSPSLAVRCRLAPLRLSARAAALRPQRLFAPRAGYFWMRRLLAFFLLSY